MIRLAYIVLNYKTYKDTICVCEKIVSFMDKDDIILIVDNMSPNESYEKLSDYFGKNNNVIVIQSPDNGGYAKGNNYGLNYLCDRNPQYVCVINNDVYFDKDCIEHLIEIYNTIPDAGAISPVQHDINDNIAKLQPLKCYTFWDDVFSYFRFKGTYHKFVNNTAYSQIQKVGFIPGSFVFISYSIFKDIGFFYDRTFLFMEETFLSKRLESINKSCYIDLSTSYIHAHSKTINSEASRITQKRYLLESRILFTKEYRKYPSLKIPVIKYAFITNMLLGKIKKILKSIKQ